VKRLVDEDGLGVARVHRHLPHEARAAHEDGNMWKNPVSGKVEDKVSYLKKAGDQTCGVGAYK